MYLNRCRTILCLELPRRNNRRRQANHLNQPDGNRNMSMNNLLRLCRYELRNLFRSLLMPEGRKQQDRNRYAKHVLDNIR